MKTGPILLGVLLLAACRDPQTVQNEALAAAEAKAQREGRVECALKGAEAFDRICTIDRVAGAEGLTLTIRSPDGSFRRLLVTHDGRGVIAADGAAPALVSVVADNRIEVTIENDRYRLPATVKAGR